MALHVLYAMAHRAHIVIPTEKSNADAVVDNIEWSLTEEFGGCSIYDGVGCWMNEVGHLVGEEHKRFVVTMGSEHRFDKEAFKEAIRTEAGFAKEALDEEAVLIEFEEVDMELI